MQQTSVAVRLGQSAAPRWSLGLSVNPARVAVLSMVAFAAVMVCMADGIAVSHNTPRTAAVGYICSSIAMLVCAVGFSRHARMMTGLLRVRCLTMVAALLVISAGYAECTPDLFSVHNPFLRPFQVVLFNTGNALYILAVVLFFSGVSRSIVLLDMLQALLLAVLGFSLTYTKTTVDHFTNYHLLVAQGFALFLFLIAAIAGPGAASTAERRFLRLLSWFFGLRFVGFFLSDQVSYTWLHNVYCSVWDVPFVSLLVGFAFYMLCLARPVEDSASRPMRGRRPSLVVRSLMPSFLALANLMLALLVLKSSVAMATVAVLVTVIAYVARTTLLQSHAFRESAQLQHRNEQLEGLATHDYLTGIGNRRSLAGVFAKLQTNPQALPEGPGLALLLMDIDYFKRANDLRGHLYGDEVLIALAGTLESIAARVPGSHCARFGGDEFALLLPGVSAEESVLFAEEARRAFAACGFRTEERSISLSIGVHLLGAARELPLEALIACADAALYCAKRLGRNRVEVYAPPQSDTGEASRSRLAWQHVG